MQQGQALIRTNSIYRKYGNIPVEAMQKCDSQNTEKELAIRSIAQNMNVFHHSSLTHATKLM